MKCLQKFDLPQPNVAEIDIRPDYSAWMPGKNARLYA